ncbi:MFS transporter [Labrys monachus]|uniref:MFS family arabinose efflux permease n=1 Tax=Labrys monachus TaxID=217067 RepID=A0ABU0FH72_9HYPH|nr:MFS transporter [Labrys monachus]MDQ0393920.1 putative MFS family arabinose efflux permease [Labrys monachus]
MSDPVCPATGWRAWYPTAAMFFVNGAIFGVWATQIPLAKLRLGLDPEVLGSALLLLGAGAVVAMAGSGWILQRIGTAALIRVSAVLFCIMLPLTCIAPDIWSLAVILFFFGASGGSMDVAMNAAASDVEKQAGKPYMSSFHGMWSIGGLTGATLATVLLGVVGGALQGLVMAAVLAAIFVWGQAELPPGRQIPATAGGQLAALRPGPLAILVGIMAALCFAAEGAVLDWAAIYLRDSLGAATEHANFGYAAFAGAMAAGRFGGDFVRRRLRGVTLLRIGCLLAFVGVLAGPLSGNVVLAIAGYALTGLGLSNVVPVLFSAAGAMPRPEAQIAVVSTLGYAGLLAAPPLLGFVAHATSLTSIYVIVAIAAALIAVLATACSPALGGRQPVTTAG